MKNMYTTKNEESFDNINERLHELETELQNTIDYKDLPSKPPKKFRKISSSGPGKANLSNISQKFTKTRYKAKTAKNGYNKENFGGE